MSLFSRVFSKSARCACCGKTVHPFSTPAGAWSGRLGSMPQIEADNAFVCEACGAIICPVCSGNKASRMGVWMFVCTQCGHKPVEKIFR